jgi:hypothetical protein
MAQNPTPAESPWFPADPLCHFRREGRAWRYEFPYKPLSSVPDGEPRYVIRMPDVGTTLDSHGWLLGQLYPA